MNEPTQKKYYKNRNADDRQAELYKKFPADSFLGNPTNTDHFMQWMTFFRRNFHRCAMDYLGLKLHIFQVFILYLMGIKKFFVIIASRADGKSFIVALAACIYCILYPGSMVVIGSGTKKQAKLLVSEKIEKELMNWSPALRKEIFKVKDNQNEVVVFFKNHSTITVVAPGDGGRGYRSTILIREEFRQIKKEDEDGILSPYQIVRQAPYKMEAYYSQVPELKEESIDIYISSSWLDNGHWMWQIVDQAKDGMLKDDFSCLMALDESVALAHGIKTMQYFQKEKKKQDPLTWSIEFMNYKISENSSSFFTYSMLQKNQICKKPFYPRTNFDCRNGVKNSYLIPKVPGEIRIVCCDMAFVENVNNDNSVFSCMRLLPESITYKSELDGEIISDNGYRRIVPYMEAVQGGEIRKQAIRIRQLFADFESDYIILDLRNSGIAVFDLLARTLFDDERDIEYRALTCMNDDNLANRIKVEGAEPRIFAINATQKLNSDIALDFRRVLTEQKIDFLVSFEDAQETILPNIKEYMAAPDGETSFFYERPFLETQALFAEAANLVYERKPDTGVIVIKEQGSNRKDRYTSISYGSYFATKLEQDLFSGSEEYEYGVYVN